MKLFNFVLYLQIFIFASANLHSGSLKEFKRQRKQQRENIERELFEIGGNEDALNLANSFLQSQQTKDLHINNIDTNTVVLPVVKNEIIPQKTVKSKNHPEIGDILHLRDQLQRLIKYRKNLDLINHQLEVKVDSIQRQTKFAQSQNSLFDYRIQKMLPIAKQVQDRKLQSQNEFNQHQVKVGNLEIQSQKLQRNLQDLLQQEKMHQQLGTNYLINYQNTQTQIQNVKNQIGEIENQIMGTQTQISKKNSELNLELQKNKEIQDQINSVKQKIETQNKKLVKKQNKERRLNQTVEEKENRRQILLEQYNDFKNEMQQLDVLKRQITDLRSKFAQKQSLFKKKKQDTEERNEQLTHEIAELKQKEEELKQRESDCECSFETIQKFVTDKQLDEVQEGAMKICISQTIQFILGAHNRRLLDDYQPKNMISQQMDKRQAALQRLQNDSYFKSSNYFRDDKI